MTIRMSPIDETGPPNAPTILTIDLGALKRNYRLLASRAGPAECAAVVKADAYGLGIGPVAGALRDAGCRTFFVATLDEALALRALAPEDPYGDRRAVQVVGGVADQVPRRDTGVTST